MQKILRYLFFRFYLELKRSPVMRHLLHKVDRVVLYYFLYDDNEKALMLINEPYKGLIIHTGVPKTEAARVLGGHWFMDDWDYEPEVRSTIQKYCFPGMVVLDVGANIGLHTITMAKAVGPTGQVYAFEPNPSTESLLKRTCEINKFQNVQVVNSAVSDEEKTGYLLYSSQSDTEACLENDGGYYFGRDIPSLVRMPIKTVSLDFYVRSNGLSHVDFVKVDVQGNEMKVLQGMRSILKHLRPIIVCEITGTNSLIAGTAFLQAIGYHTQELKRTYFGFSVKELKVKDGVPIEGPEFWVDILAVPIEMKE